MSRKIEVNGLLAKVLSQSADDVFSSICDHLIGDMEASQTKSMLVCCASSGEGATTLATGLALAMGRKSDGKILLIDGNCHNPSITNLMGLSRLRGLADVLCGAANVKEVVKKTDKPNFFLIGNGIIGAEYMKTIQPPKIVSLMKQLSENYSFILLDGPSINSYPESILYASQVDSVFFVVRAGVTRAPVAEKAFSRLSGAQRDKEKIKVVLNRRIFAIPQSIYRKL